MVRELVENAIGIVRETEMKNVEAAANARVEERLLDLLVPAPVSLEVSTGEMNSAEQYQRARESMRAMLLGGELEERRVEIQVEQKASPVVFGGMGGENMDIDIQGMFEKIMPKNTVRRELTIAEARRVLFESECDAMLDQEKINTLAIELAEDMGIIFLDEIDKVIASDSKSADVSRQGVQRDLLPIVEGTTVQTRYGYVRTDHVLFVAAGAFHHAQPSDLMPELQGRFPIRVELNDLTKDDLIRILTEPKASLTKQYAALIDTEGVTLEYTTDGIEAMADFAHRVNQSTQNIGARRLYTIMEKVLEEVSFESPDMKMGTVSINAAYVKERLEKIADNEDLSAYIL